MLIIIRGVTISFIFFLAYLKVNRLIYDFVGNEEVSVYNLINEFYFAVKPRCLHCVNFVKILGGKYKVS